MEYRRLDPREAGPVSSRPYDRVHTKLGAVHEAHRVVRGPHRSGVQANTKAPELPRAGAAPADHDDLDALIIANLPPGL
jgi:hypothetical protein